MSSDPARVRLRKTRTVRLVFNIEIQAFWYRNHLMVRNKLANANRVWGTGPRTLAPLDGRNVCMDSTVPGRSLWRRVAAQLEAVEPAVCRRWPAAERAPRGAGRAAATGRCSVGCQRSPPTWHPRAARTARTAPCGAPRGTTATLRRQRDGQTRRQMYGHSETVNRDRKRTGTASRSTETANVN